ncbi:hypothetical protein P3T18_001220 [Paraburkholderia sp. GAS199]|uniref:hypothetical protein n=1 Tax=Paraburkholderia sp. GAS199 TaxID=3035126 RepID=UPI003D1F3288
MPGPDDMTPEQRKKLCNECLNRIQDKNNLPGLQFIADVLTGDISSAVVDWVKEVVHTADSDDDCYKLVTPKEASEIAVARHQIYHFGPTDRPAEVVQIDPPSDEKDRLA